MGKWMELARQLERAAQACANSAVSANSPDAATSCVPNGTNGTIGTARRGGLVPFGNRGSSVVEEWRSGLATLDPDQPPAGIAASRWSLLLSDADRLLHHWGAQAAALGWAEVDLFGCTPGFPRRLDGDGLAVALEGRTVLAMTDEAATIDNGTSRPTRHYRSAKPYSVPLWKLTAAVR